MLRRVNEVKLPLFRVWETRMWTCERWPCLKGRCQVKTSHCDIDVIYELYRLYLGIVGTSRVFHVSLLTCFVSNNF